MHWAQSLDESLFRFINQTLANPVLDWVMPPLSNGDFFAPIVVLLAAWLLIKGGARGRLFLLALILALLVTDPLVVNNLKKLVGRERPFMVLEGVRCLVGKGGSGSFPSAHAANWFTAAMVAFLYYRRSWRFMLPLAAAVAFSRVYNGVHYPSDILAGALIGAASGAATVWLIDAMWRFAGQRIFPIWWQRLPSLANPVRVETPPSGNTDGHWLRLGYLLVGLVFVLRLIYIASGTIELVEDEAYYWLWSKELALSYYSKPPLIALTIWLGTHLFGDTYLGVRFFSPFIGSLVAILLMRFLARETNPRTGFALVLVAMTTPLLGVGSVLMTIDPLSVLFWVTAMLAGWKAIQPEGKTTQWVWVGIWMGLGLLSKYVALLQLLCWAVLFIVWPAARAHLRRPGPYLALAINLLCFLPVAIWNQHHDWITYTHVAESTQADVWKPTLRFLNDIFWSEFALLNPFWFTGLIASGVLIWKRRPKQPLEVYLFSMGAPLLIFIFLYSLKARILPNWVAPSILPLLCLMVVYWEPIWRAGKRFVRIWGTAGACLGLFAVGILHNTDYIEKIAGRPLPPKIDPLRRVRGWETASTMVNQARLELAGEGKPVFIIGHHYGVTSQMSFHIPESRENLPNSRLCYYLTSDHPDNQFYFWPGYTNRTGDNAIFVIESSPKNPKTNAPPPRLLEEFESVTDLGLQPVNYEGRALRWLQLFECRNLR